MPIINPTPPTVGDPVATAEPQVRDAIVQILALVNGGLDGDNIADGALTREKLASSLRNLLVPVGSIVMTGGATADPGYLLCDGSSRATADFPDLFARIGYAFGGAGANFNVPDMRGRVAVSPDGAAGRLIANDSLGNSGGEERHQLTVGELAGHQHPAWLRVLGDGSPGGNPYALTSTAAGTWGDTAHGGAYLGVEGAGSDQPHNNMQPFLVVNFQIKT